MPTAIDTETTKASRNSEPVPQLVSVALFDSEQGVRLYAAHDPAWLPAVRRALREGAIFHNAPFDAHVLLRAAPDLLDAFLDAYESDRIFDVQTREKLIDIAEGYPFLRGNYDLGSVAQRRAGIQVDKNDPWRLRYGELLGLELCEWPEGARAYAEKDPMATWAVWYAQERFRCAHDIDVFADAGRQARAHLALYSQTLRGMHTDQAQVDRVDARLRREITEVTLVCLDHGLVRVGGTKKRPKFVRTKAAAAAMVEEYCRSAGLEVLRTDPTRKFPEGQVSLSEETLSALRLPEGHPLEAYRRLGALQTLRSKNIPVLRRPWVRTRYDECKATGRTGSSAPNREKDLTRVGPDKWVGSNFQNQPREGGFRECLVP